MKKSNKSRSSCKASRSRRTKKKAPIPRPTAKDLLREGLNSLFFQVGLGEFLKMMEEDRENLCGPRYKQQAEREAYRYGSDQASLPFCGRNLEVNKPRVRSLEGKEIPLPTWEALASQDPLEDRVLQQMHLGVSTRNYGKSLEKVPENAPLSTPSKSTVSRKFQARTVQKAKKFLSRSLEGVDLAVIMIDGLAIEERMVLVAMGIDIHGKKHVLAVVEGTTESTEVCKSLLRDLLERGLEVESPKLFVVDGGKGLKKAIRKVFGSWALIQRCQIHKLRNIQEHLPKDRYPWARRQILAAWKAGNVETAKRKLRALASSLEDDYPSAARSILEGLEDTLTLIRLRIPMNSILGKSLRSTNPIENLNGTIRNYTKNVKRWRNGAMIIRWVATALEEAQEKFRRIKGYAMIHSLCLALKREVAKERLEQKRSIA